MTSHWRVSVGGLPDNTPMDHTYRVTASNMLSAFISAIKSLQSNKILMREVRWYDIPDTAPHKPVYIETIIPTLWGGSSTSALAWQTACSVTFRTDQRRKWGRFYIPGLSTGILDAAGRLTTANVDTICTAAAALTQRNNSPGTGKPCLCVWSRVDGTHHDPQYVEVDDVPDVIRSRRAKHPNYKKILPASP